MKLSLLLIIISSLFSLSRVLSSEHRPMITENASVNGKGILQFEFGYDHLRWDKNYKENLFMLTPFYGLTDNIELSFDIPYQFHPRYRGIGDINFNSEILIFGEQDITPSLTLKGSIKFPSGNLEKGLGSGNTDYSCFTTVSKIFKNVSVHAMIGYSFVGGNNTRNIFIGGISVSCALTDRLHIFSEVAGNRHPDRSINIDPLSGLVGTAYQLKENLLLDFSTRIGFNKMMPDLSVSAGFTYSL